jgi:phosphoenolpyruvate synthase/pyruvate phosphate dikinase
MRQFLTPKKIKKKDREKFYQLIDFILKGAEITIDISKSYGIGESDDLLSDEIKELDFDIRIEGTKTLPKSQEKVIKNNNKLTKFFRRIYG